ncbi:MAG: hypothetical protein HYY13_09445 [Nitrospirae bacterium]|nr:hypothetical protein [Nitrospirota bacterium]
MSETELRNKNLVLAVEFSRYVLTHPSFARKIPKGSQVVLVPKGDSPLRRENLRLVERIRREEPNRPLAVVQFDGLAPLQSRLKNPRLLAA